MLSMVGDNINLIWDHILNERGRKVRTMLIVERASDLELLAVNWCDCSYEKGPRMDAAEQLRCQQTCTAKLEHWLETKRISADVPRNPRPIGEPHTSGDLLRGGYQP